MPPAEAARASPRESIDHHRAGRDGLDRVALRVARVLEDVDRVDVLAGGDVAEREGRAGHAAGVRVERTDALDEDVAEAALEQHRGERRRAHLEELGPDFRGICHAGLSDA